MLEWPMRFVIGRVLIVVCVLSGIGGCLESSRDCPLVCPEAGFATFHLACSPNDLVRVDATEPCANPDAGLDWYTGAATRWEVDVKRPVAGTCHIKLTFATGFTYERDVTFTAQAGGSAGCSCPEHIAPTSGPFEVNNPTDTCQASPVDGGI
jgi:hypothetical protein